MSQITAPSAQIVASRCYIHFRESYYIHHPLPSDLPKMGVNESGGGERGEGVEAGWPDGPYCYGLTIPLGFGLGTLLPLLPFTIFP